MNKFYKKTIFFGFLILSTIINANSNPIEIVSDFGDTRGSFPDNSGRATYSDAHAYCVNVSRIANEPNTYNHCMRSFMPFLPDDKSQGNDCNSATVTWSGMCTATISSGKHNDVQEVDNQRSATNFYQGTAKYTCLNGSWVYSGGVCVELPANCQSGGMAEWPVTQPEWARPDGDVNSPRFAPKPNCKVSITTSVTSGTIINRVMDGTNPMYPNWLLDYDVANSQAKLRCFDNQWVTLENQYSCIYKPRNCAAQTYTTEKGCTFNLVETQHDRIYIATNPLPDKSIGQVRAFCWDGAWEVQSESCTLSCANQFPATTWASIPASSQSCNHPAINLVAPNERTAPNETITLNNVNTNLNGVITKRCIDGFWEADTEYCRPKTCSGVPAATWTVGGNTCQHATYDKTIPNGGTVDLPALNSPINIGTKHYQCSFGNIIQDSSKDTCNNTSDMRCYAGRDKLENPQFEIETWVSGCTATCRYIPAGNYTYCSTDCIPTTSGYCRAPVGENGTNYSRLTNTTCPIQVAATPTTFTSANIGRILDIYTCQTGTWNKTSEKCVVDYLGESVRPVDPVPGTPPVVNNLRCPAGNRTVSWISTGGTIYNFQFNMPLLETGQTANSLYSELPAPASDASCSGKYMSSGTALCVGTEWNFDLSQVCDNTIIPPTTWSPQVGCANESGSISISGSNICNNTAIVAETANSITTSAIVVPLISERPSSNWSSVCPTCNWSYVVNSDNGKCVYSQTSEDVEVRLAPVYLMNGEFCTSSIKLIFNDGSNTRTLDINARAERNSKANINNVVLVYDQESNNAIAGSYYRYTTVMPYLYGRPLNEICPSCTYSLVINPASQATWTETYVGPSETVTWTAGVANYGAKGLGWEFGISSGTPSIPSRANASKNISGTLTVSDGTDTRVFEVSMDGERSEACQVDTWFGC